MVLDKDKLRRHPYDCGFLYGIPSESNCPEAVYWRRRITNGWKILRQFHLISASVYSTCDNDCKRPNALRKVSGGVRTSRIWQAVSCQYTGCTEHGMKHVFTSKPRRDSHNSQHPAQQQEPKDPISDVRRREALILKNRLAHLDTLSTEDLLDYTYLWRLLQHVFRPYRDPNTSAPAPANPPQHPETPRTNWSAMISDISQGCSWLNFFVLHTGTSPFQTQWSLSPSSSSSHILTSLRQHLTSRPPHRLELERDYTTRFEFALRKRCLSASRRAVLDAEIQRGRAISTISLDCIPWVYDQHYCVARPKGDFPWYEDGKWVGLVGPWGVRLGEGWSGGVCRCDGGEGEGEEDGDGRGTEPLGEVRSLVYLGEESAAKVWRGVGFAF